MWKFDELTGLKLQLRLLSELALCEGEPVSGGSVLKHSGPIDGGENRHQNLQQGTCDKALVLYLLQVFQDILKIFTFWIITYSCNCLIKI